MARAWRIVYEGALYHVLSRGNEWRDIFLDDDDRTMFLTGLAEAGERFAFHTSEPSPYNQSQKLFCK